MRKNFVRKMFGIALAVGGLALFGFASCYEPSPLYGTWSDNLGNKIMLMEDGSLSVTIYADGKSVDYSGSYSVVENVISFNCTPSNGETMNTVTEWDIRGLILYIDWTTSDKEVRQLRLYHTK
ncbi:MAG: hypothetical protein NC548_58935 [Lachnospiraceae bacterium]|nr:hypothetical protein [Lachnospiraceae bacterium]